MKKLKILTDVPSLRDYFSRIGAEPRSLRTAVVKEVSGKYWRDLAVIRVDEKGAISAPLEYAPTEAEAAAIIEGCIEYDWPKIKPLAALGSVPPMVADADPKNVFEFRNDANEIVMLQVRMERDNERAYVPWTYWDDDEWRSAEPDGPLPLFNAHLLKGASTVFIHEGAKAARFVQTMVEGKTREDRDRLKAHPWGLEMTGAVHVGWIGGAMSPGRTDWTVIKKAGIARAFIVADNDEPGKSAVPKIAQALRCPTFAIQFTDEFPASFDLADRFPEKMTKGPYYTGPAFRECQHPATWATDQIPNPEGKGRPLTVLRESFRSMWAYVEESDLFVCREMPEILRPEPILNKMLASFSHVNETSKLIVKAYQGRSTRLCYRPDHEGLQVTFRGSSAINLHVPGPIKPATGDPKPFLDFLSYLFPNERERYEVERWCATLIARPDIRMSYGLLLISEKQGVGKTTLGAGILAPLVGVSNVGYPGENDVTAAFNDWVAHKRLAIVNEIYSGSSWKAYHALKSVITDKEVMVNQKYTRQYVIDNWCHVLACSNSMRALKMENDDRRWFYPEVTELPWGRDKFNLFREWIDAGGLSIVKRWALDFGDYVEPAERAPMTDRKKEMIEGSRSEAQAEAAAVAEALRDMKNPAAVALKDVVAFVRSHAQGRVFDSDYELRKAMVDCGVVPLKKRIKIGGRLQYAIANEALADALRNMGNDPEADGPKAALIRERIVKCSDLIHGEM
jgi:hypothetical protein